MSLLNAEQWNSTNKIFFDLAKKLLDFVDYYEKEKHFDIIIDIGVGSGNITEMMAQLLSHNRIYGLDVDKNMVTFANDNNKDKTVEYVLADLSGDWNSLDDTIKSLECKVSLVFSNMCIDLIKEKSIFVKNLRKLLRVNKLAYFSFPIFPQNTLKLSDEEKAIFERYVRVPTKDEQAQTWIDLFEANGYKIEHKVFDNTVWKTQNENILAMLEFFPFILDTFMQGQYKFSELPEDIKNKIMNLSMDGFCNWRESSVNWQIINQLKSSPSDQRMDCKWTITYLVCRAL